MGILRPRLLFELPVSKSYFDGANTISNRTTLDLAREWGAFLTTPIAEFVSPILSLSRKLRETHNIARYVAGGGKLPLPDDVIPETGNVSLDKSSIEIKGSVVFFSVKAKDDNDKQITVWVGVQANKESVDTLLEQRLTLGRDNTLEKDVPSSDEESTSTKPKLVDISSESTAAFGSTKAEVEGQW